MIVKMMHLDLVATAADRERTIDALRELGAVHLDLSASRGAAVVKAGEDIEKAEKAVRLILRSRGKTSREEFEIRPRSVGEVLALDEDRSTLIVERDRLERLIKTYESYGDFDPKLAERMMAVDENVRSIVGLPEKLPEMRLSKMQEKHYRVVNRIGIDEAKIASADETLILKDNPTLADKLAFEQAKELLNAEGEIAVLSGWVPFTAVEALKTKTREQGWGILLRDPADGEVPPTLMEPPRGFKAVNDLFKGLGIAPGYTEGDVSVPFMCYFSLFFAMLVGDGAYGSIFLAATLLMRKKLPKAWLLLLTVFSSATIVWGFLSNTWFGAALPFAKSWPTVEWLADPSYNHMMLLCFTIGVSHLMLARVWNGLCRLPDSTAIAEFGWAGVLLMMYLVTNSIVGIFPTFPTWGLWMGGASIAAVFLFSVKPSELKTRGAELGMLPLSIMSALGDIISYVRLFAVGLASVKVAENFNQMAIDLFQSGDAWWAKLLLGLAMIAILVFGHVLNLMMAGLSILVHAVRLNTLEFSNHKGVTWSGYAFSPFRKSKTTKQ